VRKALAALAVVLALVAGAVVVAWNSIDLIVAWTLERYGPDVTGVAVKVEEVRISPRDGKGAVRGLEVGNPPGFSGARAARLGEVRVQLDPSTITDKVVHVRELYIDTPSILYERGNRATNLEVIQKHIEGYVRGQARESPAQPTSKDAGSVPGSRDGRRRFIIDRLVIRSARVTMSNAALRGQGLSFDLPDIEMRDLGKRQGGLTASEVANAVATTLQNRIAQRVLTNIDAIRKGGVEGAIDALKGLLK
jgi:hypothetical protein